MHLLIPAMLRYWFDFFFKYLRIRVFQLSHTATVPLCIQPSLLTSKIVINSRTVKWFVSKTPPTYHSSVLICPKWKSMM